ncbi:MAG TPA: hypothetical protein PLP33_29480 [Leptospiraceae bacterium]|nr:hypothetical protein [Leptospiraceae bacterium]
MFKTIEEYLEDGYTQETAEFLAQLDSEIEQETNQRRQLNASIPTAENSIPTFFPKASTLKIFAEASAC